jgi:hypothetical protein
VAPSGCPAAPPDADSDGVADASDQCPTLAGPASNNGCPTTPAPPTNSSNNCMPNPSACGFPDVETTGVQPGVRLTPVSGNVVLNTPGQVYENKLVTGKIDVYASNVTIRNVKLVMTNDWYGIEMHTNGSQPGNAKDTIIEDVEIDANGRYEAKGIAFNEYHARRVFFHNGSDCAHLGQNASVEDSLCSIGPDTNGDGWEDSQAFCNNNGPHYDGLQTDFGYNQVYRHNTIRIPCGQTSAILISTNTSAIRDVTIADNLMAGGGYTLYCDAGPLVGGTETVTGNRIAKTYYGAGRAGGSDSGSSGGGYWGPTTGCQHADVYSGNVWDDTGQPIQ